VPDARLDAADHARAAAEGDRREPPLGAYLEHAPDLVLVAGPGDHVRRPVEAAAETAHHVSVGAAHRVAGPLARVGGDDPVEGIGRAQARRCELDGVDRDGHLDPIAAEAEATTDLGGERLEGGAVGLAVGVTPSPMASFSLLWHAADPIRMPHAERDSAEFAGSNSRNRRLIYGAVCHEH
jgi:hypothetical protein